MRRWLTVGPGLVVVGLLGWWVLPADRPARVVTVASAALQVAPLAELAAVPPPPVVTTTTTTEPEPEPTTTTTAPPVRRAPAVTTTTAAAAEPTTTSTTSTTSTTLDPSERVFFRDSSGYCFLASRGSLTQQQPDLTCTQTRQSASAPVWFRDPRGYCVGSDSGTLPAGVKPDPTCP